jgi:hypothetical protein
LSALARPVGAFLRGRFDPLIFNRIGRIRPSNRHCNQANRQALCRMNPVISSRISASTASKAVVDIPVSFISLFPHGFDAPLS